MKQYHIGLDFGTYQSKVCIYHIDDDVHEFFNFDNGTFFLPSRVAKKTDGRLEYGSDRSGEITEEYYYFKIAAAEDDEFHAETFDQITDSDKNFYKFNEFQNYTPEFLSVVYLTYVLFTVKEWYLKLKRGEQGSGGLLGRLFSRQEQEEEIRFTSQLGIPTEWSQQKNLKRKRKFENILMLAEQLQQKYKTRLEFLSVPADQLIEDVKTIYSSYGFKSRGEFDSRLNELGISIYPETAAALTFMIMTDQLTPDYYAAMDIGAGSTDVSFFRVLKDRKIKYLASESYIVAANDVYRQYSGNDNSIVTLRKAQDEVQVLVNNNNWFEDKLLKSVLEDVNDKLDGRLYKLFNKRVYYFHTGMVKEYSNQPIIIYGGGARLPILNSGAVMVHDHGNKLSLNILRTSLEKSKIEKYASIINILPNNESWKPEFAMLVVALGLSYIKPDSAAEWFDKTSYHDRDDGSPILVQHPFNEDCYIYDVLSSEWK